MDARDLFDEDHEAFRDSVRRFLAAEVVPNLDDWRIAGRVPADLLAAAGEHGLLGTAVPEELGGGGTDDLRFTAVLVEETAAVGAIGLALTFALHSGVCLPLILDLGTEQQRKSWVPGLAAGEQMASVAALGSPLVAGTEAGQVVLDVAIDGVASGVYPGPVLTAIEIDGVRRLLVVPGDAETLDRAAATDSLGAADVGLADLMLRGAVSDDNLIGLDHDPLTRLRCDLDLWSGVLAVAAARSVLGLTLDYVRERKVFGRPLSEFENTRHTLAAVSAGIESAQVFVYRCLELRAAGTLTSSQAATARLGAAAIHDRSVDQGMQLHGGYGYMREYPISHAFADARFLRVHASSCSNALDAVAAGLGI